MSDKTDTVEAAKETPPAGVSFFDPALKAVRRRVFFLWSRTLLMLCVLILAALSLFWASQFRVEKNYPALTIWVVDFDGQVDPSTNQSQTPMVGPAVVETAQHIIDSPDISMGYTIKSPADFHYDPVAVRQGVYDEHAYAAIVVKPNATALLYDAVTTGNTAYDPADAAEFIIISARDQSTYSSYITPGLNEFADNFLTRFGPRWIQHVSQESLNISRVPQAINPAAGFTTVDLRPFRPAVAAPAVTIGLIYLIILAFFNFPFLMPVHALFLKPDGHPPLKVPQWLLWRLCSNIAAYFFLSLFYSLVSLAFQVPFSNDPAPDTVPAANANAYGRGSFVVFWMLNWVGMTALGLPCENMAMILGFPWSSFFLIFWVITNVATGFYALDLTPGFFHWGYAWPLHRIVEALRTILFGTHSRIGLDFGILFAWIAVSIALFPVASLIMRWKMQRGLQ
ncbi:MNNG and nitrosoguanidine resistance protein [Aspergillus terreus]|uniref:MNNG and nitrosoguanidine resistance protein n=1 Tax=Aspergillus terreus TaxID=33178 RepID=A0A5M3YTY6_ASPTE|nr:hypothetical protein ATETN484_0004026400 [Aspergillus terreus]GFF13154.1 MNNG and nitrosoguanidine resistance protein [Aspergillus terreus]